MDPKEPKEVTVETLLALRQERDALRLITERLRVKEMGPADHIRTKHEVKSFVESGDTTSAAVLITASRTRVSEQRAVGQSVAQRHASRQTQ